MIAYETNYLAHHGVKGMKWGVRKDRYKNNVTYQENRRHSKIRNAVKRYSKASDIYSKRQDKLDSDLREVKNLYKKTGKTYVSRVFNNIKFGLTGSSKYAKQIKDYNSKYDKWSSNQDANDAYGRYVDSLYAQTGKNFVDRVINNIKYDPIKKK